MVDVEILRCLANEKRLQILNWLKDPRAHFREQADGDLVSDGVCGVLISEKLGVTQATLSEHMRILVRSGLVRAKRVKQWTFYSRNDERIADAKAAITAEV